MRGNYKSSKGTYLTVVEGMRQFFYHVLVYPVVVQPVSEERAECSKGGFPTALGHRCISVRSLRCRTVPCLALRCCAVMCCAFFRVYSSTRYHAIRGTDRYVCTCVLVFFSLSSLELSSFRLLFFSDNYTHIILGIRT